MSKLIKSLMNKIHHLELGNKLALPNPPNLLNHNLNFPPHFNRPQQQQLVQQGKRANEPSLQPPLRNNSNLVDKHDDAIASQIRNPDEDNYPNVDSINYFHTTYSVSHEYLEEFWNP